MFIVVHDGWRLLLETDTDFYRIQEISTGQSSLKQYLVKGSWMLFKMNAEENDFASGYNQKMGMLAC